MNHIWFGFSGKPNVGGEDLMLIKIAKRWTQRGVGVNFLTSLAGKELFEKLARARANLRFGGKMKIVAFLNAYVQGVSGGDSRFIEIMKKLCEKGDVELTVVTSKLGKDFCRERGLNAVFRVTTQEHEVGNVVLLYARRILSALLLNLEIEKHTVLYSTSQFLPDVLPIYVLKFKNKNVKWVQAIYHLVPLPTQREGHFITNLTSFSAQKFSFPLIRRNADLIFVLTDLVKSQLVKLGFSKERIYVIGAGINLSQIDEIQRLEGVDYDACFLGRLHIAKGIFDLIEIWKFVVSKKKSAKLAIIYVGPKDLESALAKRIKEENLCLNVFMLPLTGKDALSVVKSSKVFAFPSHEEGWGIAISEAMACGLPVVAYDLPAYKEIFTQGIVTVPMRDTKSFSNEIINLLENDKKRNILGEKGRIQVTMYDWESVATRELSLIKRELS
jgi:glycosyltransferase involved in cell wall biosynthesis